MKLDAFLKYATTNIQKPPPPQLMLKKNFSVNFTTQYGSAMPDGRPAPLNIGNIPGTKNPVDNQPWEVVVPGMQMALSGIKVDRIVGVITERAGDHTIVGIPVGMMDQKQFQDQLEKFIQVRKRYDPSARFVPV
jgi:hypothetical protein